MMKKDLMTAISMTIVTTVLLGLIYPLAVTVIAQLLFPEQANGSLVRDQSGKVIGSRLIGQPFSSPGYFHPRPSAAGPVGYDAAGSAGSNLGPTSAKLIDRIRQDVGRLRAENPTAPIPVDLVTASGSGLDPHISPAAAEFQLPRVARERKMSEDELRELVARHVEGRWLGLFGEPRVNVFELNLELDRLNPMKR